ncbi:MAG: serine acetyltransferase [Pseudomonadota bacterium]
MSNWDALKGDTFRQYGDFSWLLTLKGAITRRTFRVIVTLRLCQAVANSNSVIRLTLPFFKIIHKIATHWASMDFSWKAQIGSGLALTHGWGLVISPGARIGNNVTIFHGVTLGARDRITSDGSRLTEYPTLEDEVWCGPNAIIVGGITIGRGSKIAGGAFVTESIPPYSIVVGNPSKIVKSGCIADVMNRAPLEGGMTQQGVSSINSTL